MSADAFAVLVWLQVRSRAVTVGDGQEDISIGDKPKAEIQTQCEIKEGGGMGDVTMCITVQ